MTIGETVLIQDSPARAARGLFSRPPAVRIAWLVLATELLLTLLIQLPIVADFKKFAFYDEGSWLYLDALFAQGRVPTIDLGYSYGMLPLMLSRAWFALLGRSPGAFIAFIMLCDLIAAWGVARILEALGLTWQRLLLACALLPHAIFVSNYSFMHPLEMMLIVLSLAQLARRRFGTALLFATLAVFTKPSMAYVLGLLLLLTIAWLRQGWKPLLPPLITAAATWAVSIAVVGWEPAWRNILPLTGGKSYQLMNFGITRDGLKFWWHPFTSIPDLLAYYFCTPAAFWIIATLLTWLLALPALRRLLKKQQRPSDALLVTVAALHAAFVGIFYAWHGSWTYYGYLPVLGMLIILAQYQFRAWFIAAFLTLALLACAGRFGGGVGAWRFWERSPETAGLWTYDKFRDEFTIVRTRIRDASITERPQALYIVNGALPLWWPDIQTPECWFMSPGIPTPPEIERIRKQLDAAQVIVLFKAYDQNQEVLNWPEFKTERQRFTRTLWDGTDFLVLQREN